MTPVPPPSPQQAVVQRLRLHVAKRGRLRFSSHRDFQRAFERALRRAQVPIAYSQGFSPHPRISYAGAAPTGAASEAEYLEIGVVRRCVPEELRAALDAALPDGFDVVAVVEASGGAPLPDRLEASVWEIVLPGVRVAAAAAAVGAFCAAEHVEVQRLTSKGMRTFDARAAVVYLSARDAGADGGDCAILRLVVRHGSPSVRPDDVLAGLRRVAALEPPSPPVATRLAQGPLDVGAGTVGDPLAPDREASPGSAAAGVPGPAADA